MDSSEDPESTLVKRYAACLRALVGLRESIARGMRLVYTPTFHPPLIVCIDVTPGYIEWHRVPTEVLHQTFWHGKRFEVPDAETLAPCAHLSDLAELPPDAIHTFFALTEALPSSFEARGYRDGMSVGIEYAIGGETKVFGETFPVGVGPKAHTALARAVLRHCITAFPNAGVESLDGYFSVPH